MESIVVTSEIIKMLQREMMRLFVGRQCQNAPQFIVIKQYLRTTFGDFEFSLK